MAKNPSIEDAIRYWCWKNGHNLNGDGEAEIWIGIGAFQKEVEKQNTRDKLSTWVQKLKDDFARDTNSGKYNPPNCDNQDMSFTGFPRMDNPVDMASMLFRRTLSSNGLESTISSFRHASPGSLFPF